MVPRDNFNMMTLAKYWPDLTPEERKSMLIESQLPPEVDGTLLSSVNFGTVAEVLQAAGVSLEDERWDRLTRLVCEKAAERAPRCPCCGRQLIVIPDEGSTCTHCDWVEGPESIQAQLDDLWRK